MGKYAELSFGGGCLCAVFFTFKHNFIGYGYHCFQRCFEGTSGSFDKQNLLGNDVKKCHILLWVDSTTFKPAPPLDSIIQDRTFQGLATCYPGYWRIEFPVSLLNLLQPVPSRIFIILKLKIICWRKFVSELFSFCIEHLPNR